MPSALDYLNITPPGNNLLSQFFPQTGGDDALRSQLEERPVNRTALPPEYAVAGMLPPDQAQGFLDLSNRIKSDMQSQNAIKGLKDLDFGSKDYPKSVARLLSNNPLAAQNSAVQNLLKLKEFSSKQANDTKYSSAAAQAAKDFLTIPEDAPDYDERYQKFIGGLDPEVLNHPRLASFVERGMHNSSVIRSKRDARQQERTTVEKEARRLGIKPSKYDNLDDLNDAIADQMAESGQRKELSELFKSQPELRKEYASSMSRLRAPTDGPDFDQEKMEAVGKAKPQDMTKDDWVRGDYLAKQKRLNAVRSLNEEIALSTGFNPMRGMGSPDVTESSTPAISGQELPVATPSRLPATLLPEGAAGAVAPPVLEQPEAFAPVGTLPAPVVPPTGFAAIQQQLTAQQSEQAAKEATAAVQARQQEQASTSSWETAKQELLKNFKPGYANWDMGAIPALATALGKKPTDTAFKDANGRAFTWSQVAQELMTDPRMDQIRSGRLDPLPAPVDPKTAALRAKYKY